MKNLTAGLFLLFFTLFIFSCNDDRSIDDYSSDEYSLISDQLTLPKNIYSYELHLGEHFLPDGKTYPQINTIALGEIQANNNIATLGRVLFYDKNLSIDRNISCASCHKQESAFSDDVQFSIGVGEIATKRNALALATTLSFKISYSPINSNESRSKFSWDDSAADLPQQVRNAFRTENQMNISDELIVERIGENAHYPVLFTKAFGESNVDAVKISEAITAFIDAISSTQSRFDSGLKSSFQFSEDVSFSNFSDQENIGKSLFNDKCASCHTSKHNFTVKSSANNGLDINYSDKGIGGRLNEPSLFGVFKVPFLRNIGLSAPYMHDGRFESLEEVIDHYSSNIKLHPNLSKELLNPNGTARNMNFSDNEKEALVAYLHTLTDFQLAYDDKFSNPFK